MNSIEAVKIKLKIRFRMVIQHAAGMICLVMAAYYVIVIYLIPGYVGRELSSTILTVTELVARGEREAALDFLDAAQQRLDEHKTAHCCRPPVLDAVFSFYFEQAQRQGVRVDAKIALPEELPVDEGELAIVFANALENAIHACMELSQREREVRCKVIGHPSLLSKTRRRLSV